MSISFVQKQGAFAAASSVTATLGSTTTTGNLLVVIAGGIGTGSTISSISGGGVTTFTKAKSSNVRANIEIWYGVVTSGSSTGITVNFTGTSPFSEAFVAEFSGAAVSSVVDQTNSNSSAGTSVTSGNITTTNANDLLIVGFQSTNNDAVSGPTNSFTSMSGGYGDYIQCGYRIPGTTGTYSSGYGTTSAAGGDAVIAAFFPLSTAYTKTVSDIITLSDGLNRKITVAKTDILSLVDTSNRAIGKTFSEVYSLIETYRYTQGLIFAEVYSIVETINRAISVKYSEVISLIDLVNKATMVRLAELFTLRDALNNGVGLLFSETYNILERFVIRNIIEPAITYFRRYILDVSEVQIPYLGPVISYSGSIDPSVTYFKQYLGRI